MLFKPSALLLVLLSVSFTASAAPRPETNAQRMARGLPPNPPKFKRAQSPTRVGRAVPSSVPPVTYNGRIDVRDSNGLIIGRVRYQPDDSAGGLALTLDRGDELELEVKAPKPQSVPTDILVTNNNFPGPAYLGTAGTVDGQVIGSGLPNKLAFTHVIQTPPSSPPVTSGALAVESAIWMLNPDNFALTPQYVNPGPTTPTIAVAYDGHSLFFVGDLAAYNANQTVHAGEVKLYLTCEGH